MTIAFVSPYVIFQSSLREKPNNIKSPDTARHSTEISIQFFKKIEKYPIFDRQSIEKTATNNDKHADFKQTTFGSSRHDIGC